MTMFLNVDLEIGSRTSLEPLIAAMRRRRNMHELFVGRIGRLAHAHYEVSLHGATADATMRRLAEVVARLRGSARRCWERATQRDFNIGIQSGFEPRSFELPLAQATIAAVAALGGRIVVTVYAPESPAESASTYRPTGHTGAVRASVTSRPK